MNKIIIKKNNDIEIKDEENNFSFKREKLKNKMYLSK